MTKKHPQGRTAIKKTLKMTFGTEFITRSKIMDRKEFNIHKKNSFLS